jgi:hypothetical protein
MLKRLLLFVSLIMVFTANSCIKETYDMNKLSGQVQLSPTLALAAVKGDVSFSDMVKSSDTVVFDQNKLVKIVFRKDSVINLKMADFYDLSNMVAFSDTYTIGDLAIANFQSTSDYTLNQMIQSPFFPTALKNQFTALNDGALHPFPVIPPVTLAERAFTPFTNFETAVFKSGFIDIIIKNNLTAPLNSINVSLFNTSGHTAIGTTVNIPATLPGQTAMASVDLTDKTVTNSIIAAIALLGSPGNSTPVLINLNSSNIQITIRGRDLRVKSGRVVLPAQNIASAGTLDTVTMNPGAGIELDELKVSTGNLSYHVQSTTSLTASLTITLPTSSRNSLPVSQVISIVPGSHFDGNISLLNTTVDLGVDPLKPFNRLPLVYGVAVNSNNTIVNFNQTDKVQLDLKMLNPVFDYVKGYFGQQVETITPDSLDLQLADVLSHITGSILISNPSIKINYSNSFAIPIQVTLNAKGKRNSQVVNLGLAPFNLTTPVYPTARDVMASLTVDKNNSSLPQLISMPPDRIVFSGSAKMNPSGNNGLRNNYVFGNSRFLGSLEIEVPMEFRINNLQFTDTLDNFLKDNSSNSDNPVKPENFELLRVDMKIKNGFPFGISLKMSLYDPLTKTVKSTVDATNLLEPAQVDVNGKVTVATETATSLEFTRQFFSSISKSDKIIFKFTLNTTGNGAKDIKIYSDYRINFSAALVAKPVIKLK